MLLCYNIGNLDDYFKYENDCNDISSFNDLSMLIKLENEEEVIDQAIKFKFVLKKLVEQLNVLVGSMFQDFNLVLHRMNNYINSASFRIVK